MLGKVCDCVLSWVRVPHSDTFHLATAPNRRTQANVNRLVSSPRKRTDKPVTLSADPHAPVRTCSALPYGERSRGARSAQGDRTASKVARNFE
ncbi:MAG: hypothetical protein IJW55_09450 [Clostridia bacterium]|nr:hypothetical protein [Clostridia bacterium]